MDFLDGGGGWIQQERQSVNEFTRGGDVEGVEVAQTMLGGAILALAVCDMHLFEFMLQVCFPAAVDLHVLFLQGGGEGGGWGVGWGMSSGVMM